MAGRWLSGCYKRITQERLRDYVQDARGCTDIPAPPQRDKCMGLGPHSVSSPITLARVPKMGTAWILPQALEVDGASRFILVVCTRARSGRRTQSHALSWSSIGVDSDKGRVQWLIAVVPESLKGSREVI